MKFQTRTIRVSEAHHYLGMPEMLFRQAILPELVVVPMGNRGLAIDRYDLDMAWDEIKQVNENGVKRVEAMEHQRVVKSGTNNRTLRVTQGPGTVRYPIPR